MSCHPQPPAGLMELLNKQSAEHPYRRRVAGALGAVDLEATPAQREAGNFRMGHVRFHGLDLSIEWPAGSTRVGTGKDGRTWRRLMKASYGYLKRTEGADGEHIDVYLGDHPESELVFVVDQLKQDGGFDEHKVVLGTTNIEAARKLYLAHYPAGWKAGKIVPMTMARFKKWVETGATWKPAASTVKAADLLSGIQLQPHQQRIQELAADHPIRMLLMHSLGSGKCVRGHVPVLTSQGLAPISDLFPVDQGFVGEEWLSPIPGLQVVSYRDGRTIWQPVRHLYRQRLEDCEQTVVVTTCRGSTIEVTLAHRFLVVRDGALTWLVAGELRPGDVVAVANEIPRPAGEFVENYDCDLAKLMAWQVAEGWENSKRPLKYNARITQKDLSVLRTLSSALCRVTGGYAGQVCEGRQDTTGRPVKCAYLALQSKRYGSCLEQAGYEWGFKSSGKKLPKKMVLADALTLRQVLSDLFDAEGSVGSANIEFTSASLQLLLQVQYALLRFSIRSSFRPRQCRATNGSQIWRTYYRMFVSGDDAEEFFRSVGFVHYGHKAEAARRLALRSRNPNMGVPTQYFLDVLRRLDLDGTVRAPSVAKRTCDRRTATDLVERLSYVVDADWQGLGRLLDIAQPARQRKRRFRIRPVTEKTVQENHDLLVSARDNLAKVLASNLRLEQVESIDPGEIGGIVYDFEIDHDDYDAKNYVAGVGGFVVHNTVSALAAGEAKKEPYSIVSPAALRSNWQSERAKFTDQKTPAEVLSYSELAKGRQPAHADTLIFDEAHRLRNPGSKQTQAAFDAAEKAQNLLLLSGTPLQNRPGDVAPLMSLLTRQTISPDDFEKRYVGERTVSPGLIGRLLGVTPGVEPAVKHRAELERMLQGHVDYYAPDRPTVPVDRQDYEVEMSPQQAQLYKAMHDELPWMLRWKLQRQFPLSRSELRRALTFLSGPRQVGLSTYPFMKGQDRDPYRAYEQSSKLQKAYELMKETLADPRKKAIVFSSYIDAGLRPYAAALARDNVPHAIFHGGLSDEQRRRMVADYNANKLRVALVGPAGAEGISLRGAQLQQILDPHFNPVRNRQAEGRGLRFDSHEGLPEDLRNMKVQRFISKMPLGAWDKVLQAVGVDRARSRRAADDYLRDMEARKERAVGQFADLLREVGSKRGAAPPPPDDLARLLQAKNYSDHRAYDAKYALVLPMIRQKPEDWIVDEDDGRTPYAGVTHRPSGFRLHLPRAALGALQGSAT